MLLWDDNPNCGFPGVKRVSYKDSGHGIEEILKANPALIIMDSYWDHNDKCSNSCCDNNTQAFKNLNDSGNHYYLLPVGHPETIETCKNMSRVAIALMLVCQKMTVKEFLLDSLEREKMEQISLCTGLNMGLLGFVRTYLSEEHLNQLSYDRIVS
jgi:hypothetical protein